MDRTERKQPRTSAPEEPEGSPAREHSQPIVAFPPSARREPAARCAGAAGGWFVEKASGGGSTGVGGEDGPPSSSSEPQEADAGRRRGGGWAEGEERGQKTTEVRLSELGAELEGLRLCCPRQEQELSRSLSRVGQLAPVLVYEVEGRPELVDGFKRRRAALSLGWRALRAEVVDADGVGAKLRLMHSNARGGLHALEEAWLVRALYRQEGLSQPQIALLLGRDKSWVSRRLVLAEGLSDEVEGAVRLGLVSATAARELGRLPRGNQDEASRVVVRRGLTSRQTARLVERLLRAGDEVTRSRLLAEAATGEGEPAGVERPARSGAAARSVGEWIVADAAALTRLGARLTARLLERSLRSLGDEAGNVAAESLRTLRPSLASLGEVVERSLARLEASR